ncbi:MAG: hypothetical protein M0R03_23305 [Novosphingobium sp.]|nr:hypothetical protein [Novosphingobium sp.]
MKSKTITVKELIAELKKVDENKNIYMSRDTEGNEYSTLNKMNIFQDTEDNESIILWPFEEYLQYEDIDSIAKMRDKYYNSRKRSLLYRGVEKERANFIAIDEAYNTNAPTIPFFINKREIELDKARARFEINLKDDPDFNYKKGEFTKYYEEVVYNKFKIN